ncbi:unnamed protein product [Lactuca saligna]|uniref:Uncharacterized protein n=1 Tax=Lactuca saligna TaxID=75948 RepID=A0AA35ZS43_LACSI|nr:unnamed protein product [Lactuca saligna]
MTIQRRWYASVVCIFKIAKEIISDPASITVDFVSHCLRASTTAFVSSAFLPLASPNTNCVDDPTERIVPVQFLRIGDTTKASDRLKIVDIYKGGLFRSATEHKEQIRYSSQQDLRELFSILKQGFDVSLTQQELHEEHDYEHKMDASLKYHTKFFESLGIAGISNHSLLFSKTAPFPFVQDEELTRQSTYVGNSSSYNSHEPNMDVKTENLTHQHVDARSKARYDHVPENNCIPFAQLRLFVFYAVVSPMPVIAVSRNLGFFSLRNPYLLKLDWRTSTGNHTYVYLLR